MPSVLACCYYRYSKFEQIMFLCVSGPLINYYTCPKCFKVFTNYHTFGGHKRYDCGQVRRHVCEYCNKSYKRKQHLKFHLNTCRERVNKVS